MTYHLQRVVQQRARKIENTWMEICGWEQQGHNRNKNGTAPPLPQFASHWRQPMVSRGALAVHDGNTTATLAHTIQRSNSRPHALADPRLARDDAPLTLHALARNGHALVEHGLEQRRGELAHEQDVVGCDGPNQACWQQQVAVSVFRDQAATNRRHHAADVMRVFERCHVSHRASCRTRMPGSGSKGREGERGAGYVETRGWKATTA